MFVAANLVEAIAHVLGILLTILYWLVLIRAVISWVNPDPYNPIVQFLYRSTEPFLAPVRAIIPAWRTGIDFSPIVVVLILILLQKFLVRTLLEVSARLRM
jgi:YggT family protein